MRIKRYNSTIKRVASKICGSTLMAVMNTDYPLRWGNHFSLDMGNGVYAGVANMSAEDFMEICRRKKLYSVEVLYLTEQNVCFIVDDRVPRDWLLPHEEEREAEKFTIIDTDESILDFKVSYKRNSDAGFYYCPYVPKITDDDYSLKFSININPEKDGEK